jgi:hypothetical protein
MKAAQFSVGLPEVSGAQFGRNIENYSKEIFDAKKAFCIKVRSQVRAVVLNPLEYDDLISIREKYEMLVQEQGARALDAARSEFQELYAQMASKKSAEAMRSMINVTADDLAETYKPGGTETK